jgi:RNA polymerase sigma factor (sigma-70 family)
MTAPPQGRRTDGRSDTFDLVGRCRDHDEEAWCELVSRYERLVYGVATHEGLAAADAADVTQSVFEALLDALAELRDEQRLSSWLYTVARRQSWRVLRRRRRETCTAAVGDDVGPRVLVNAGHDDPPDVDVSLWIHEALAHLGAPCRDLIGALYFDPAAPSYAEVALRLGRPVGSIGPTRARCLQHLRSLLEGDPGDA